METKKLLQKVLNLPQEWKIGDVSIIDETKIHIQIIYTSKEGVCKKTGEICPVYDYRPERKWRHLDFLGFQTYLLCRVPRIKNSLGEILSVPIPWSDDDPRQSKEF